MENGILLMKSSTIRNCLENNPLVSMQGKINMLNHMLRAKLENEVTGKSVTYPPDVKKELFRKYRRHFRRDVWKGSIFKVYQDFLRNQEENGKTVPFAENSFDLYDLAALAYIYKRIKEIDGIREANHVIIDEAQDFGMMAYGALAYCLRGCTYTIMGDVSQNIHYGYGIGIASEETVLCCTVPMYGTYIHTEGDGQIDYYFLYGGDYDGILELYRMIQGMQEPKYIGSVAYKLRGVMENL